MYLHVITVTDIADPHGTNIAQLAIDGKRGRKSHLKWSTQTTPTSSDWTLWKSSLQRALMLHSTSIQHPIGTRNSQSHHQYTTSPPKSMFLFTSIPSPHSMKATLDILPLPYTSALGHISLPRDNGRSIVADMINGPYAQTAMTPSQME